MSSTKRPRSPSPTSSSPPQSSISASAKESSTLHAISTSPSPINDRQSHFRAVYSPTASVSELRAHPSIEGASHQIAAWRLPRKQAKRQTVLPGAPLPPPSSASSSTMDTGWDDDGEARAGRRVLSVLEATGAQGTVVVGRWWGGVMLGPVRFVHIENAARGAVEASRGFTDGENVKKVKITEERDPVKDEKEKKRLVDVLPTRDEHIAILRSLLAEKKQLLDQKSSLDQSMAVHPSASASTSSSSPPKKMQYGTMELAVLKRLENARDATIAFVLKEIEKVEAKLDASEKVILTDASKDNNKDKDGFNPETANSKPVTEHHASNP